MCKLVANSPGLGSRSWKILQPSIVPARDTNCRVVPACHYSHHDRDRDVVKMARSRTSGPPFLESSAGSSSKMLINTTPSASSLHATMETHASTDTAAGSEMRYRGEVQVRAYWNVASSNQNLRFWTQFGSLHQRPSFSSCVLVMPQNFDDPSLGLMSPAMKSAPLKTRSP